MISTVRWSCIGRAVSDQLRARDGQKHIIPLFQATSFTKWQDGVVGLISFGYRCLANGGRRERYRNRDEEERRPERSEGEFVSHDSSFSILLTSLSRLRTAPI